MTWIQTEPADADTTDLLDSLADPVTGRTDEILRVHALDPAGLRAHLELYRASMRGTPGLPAVERELIAFVVSDLNGCVY